MLWKYVDDIFIAFKPNKLETIKYHFARILLEMPLKIELEDKEHSITYLDMQISRRGRDLVHTWYSKPYSSNTLI